MLTEEASSQCEESRAEHGPGAMLQDLQQQESGVGVKYTLVSHYVVTKAMIPDGEAMYITSHLRNGDDFRQMRLSLVSAALLACSAATSAVPDPRPVDLLPSDVHPNAESWKEIFEKTSFDHCPSTWGKTSLPMERFRLSFVDSSPDLEDSSFITRIQAADLASEKPVDDDHSALTLSEHGSKASNGKERPSRPLVTKYEWQPATTEELTRLESLWDTRDTSHAVTPAYR